MPSKCFKVNHRHSLKPQKGKAAVHELIFQMKVFFFLKGQRMGKLSELTIIICKAREIICEVYFIITLFILHASTVLIYQIYELSGEEMKGLR